MSVIYRTWTSVANCEDGGSTGLVSAFSIPLSRCIDVGVLPADLDDGVGFNVSVASA